MNNYGDLNTYLTKEFSLTKKALNSLSMFKKKEEEEVLKNQQLPDEIGRILKCFYYLLDEKVEDNMNNKQLFENLLTNILKKSGDKTFKDLLVNYFNNNKFLNLTQEKAGNINKIINEDNNILSMTTITKICRPISLFCFLLKEIYEQDDNAFNYIYDYINSLILSIRKQDDPVDEAAVTTFFEGFD